MAEIKKQNIDKTLEKKEEIKTQAESEKPKAEQAPVAPPHAFFRG